MRALSVSCISIVGVSSGEHTGGEALLELLGLVGVLKNQGVEVLLASDLELDVVGLLVLLDPGGCWDKLLESICVPHEAWYGCFGYSLENVQEASLRRQISMNCEKLSQRFVHKS